MFCDIPIERNYLLKSYGKFQKYANYGRFDHYTLLSSFALNFDIYKLSFNVYLHYFLFEMRKKCI